MSDAEAEAAGKEKLTVTLSVGDNRLVFDRAAADAGKAGYFKAVEASNTVKVVLSGQYNKAAADEAPEYVAVNWTKEITGCKAGQWRKVSIGVLNADEGNVQFQVTVEREPEGGVHAGRRSVAVFGGDGVRFRQCRLPGGAGCCRHTG